MKLVLLSLLLASCLVAESKTEKDLRAQLAASQAALSAATKAQASNAHAITGLTSADRTRAEEASDQSADQSDAVRQAQNANAGAAQLAAIAAKSQLQTLIITTLAGFFTLFCGFAGKAYQDQVNYRRAEAATASHRTHELSKIDEVGVQAKAAYTEANTVNQKIEKIGLQMKDGSSPKPQEK